MEDKIPKKNKSESQELVNPNDLLVRQEKEDFKPSEYLDHTCYKIPRNSNPGKYKINIPRFDSGMPKDLIIFLNLLQKILEE